MKVCKVVKMKRTEWINVYEICWEDDTLTSGKVFSLKITEWFLPFLHYLHTSLAKALKSRRFKLLSILEFISLGRDSSQDTSLSLSFSQPIRFESHTKLPVTSSAAILGPAPMSHVFLLRTTLNLIPLLPGEMENTQEKCSSFTLPVFPIRCSVKDNAGVYAASALCLHQCVLNCSCGPGPELVGLICLREAEKYQKGCAETLKQHGGSHSKLEGGTLVFPCMKALGAYGDIKSQLSFTTFITSRYLSIKIWAKLKSKQDFY